MVLTPTSDELTHLTYKWNRYLSHLDTVPIKGIVYQNHMIIILFVWVDQCMIKLNAHLIPMPP